MSSPDTRREAMSSFEKVLARICLEHGWASRTLIADTVRARSESPSVSASLSSLLVAQGALTAEQASVLEKEAADVTRTGAYASVREEDTRLGEILVRGTVVPADHVDQALAQQAAAAAQRIAVPRLGEILIEKGVLTFAKLQEALQRQTAMRVPSADSTEPEEVIRHARNPDNVFGKYVLVGALGKGSMGAVYKAWDRGLRRWVAIKVLLATSDPQLVLRFRREAETAAAIQHPNIVPIYDIGESAGRPFLVMKFVEGSTLAGMSLSLEQAVDVSLQAARGVAYAHERDVVHRDLKPGNVMVDGSGHVVVTDFGLAKDLYSGGGLTKPGTVMGTPSYMPPEQASGNNAEVDRSSDVYALGAILYELLTGRPPFRDTRIMETIRQVLEDPVPPPSTLRAGISPALEAVVLKALEKDKRRRYPTASAFAKALEAALQPAKAAPAPEPVPAPAPVMPAAPAAKPPRSASKIVFWAVVLLVLSLLSGVGVLALLRGGLSGGK